MTDQTEFERELTDRLRARADRTRVELDHARVIGAPRPARRASGRPTWAGAGAFAAVIALVVVGLALLIRSGDDEPAPADTFPPVVTAPATTVPPLPDYGVLDDTDGPTVDDHWHVAYGFFLCGQWFQLSGNLEELDAQGNFVNDRFVSNGLHSHDDGVIHVHPYAAGGAGDNATLRTFLANYGVVLDLDGFFATPPDQLADVPCDDAPQHVVIWPDATNPVDPIVVSSGPADVPLRDGAAITITDTLEGVTPPPWAAALPDLAALDAAQLAPDDLLQPVPTTATSGTIAPVGPMTDFAACGRVVAGPSSDLGVVTERLDVAPDGSSFELTLRNTTTAPITVGVAPFLTTLGADGAVMSRPSVVGVWQYQVVSPDEALTVPVGEMVAGASVLGTVWCPEESNDRLPPGAHEFVAVLDVGGTIVSTEPVTLAVSDGGAVVASSVPTTP